MRYSFLLLLIAILACTESTVTPDPNRLGLNYFPLEVGSFRVYDVEEINYTVLAVDTFNYQLREIVSRKAVDITGDSVFIIYRESRSDELEAWQLDSVWTARLTGTAAVMVENNVSFLKMVFPIRNDSTWDGNSLNVKSPEFYRYDTFFPDTVLNDTTYMDLVKVIQSDQGEDFLGRDDRMEIYVQDIGLLIKESVVLKFCQMDCAEEKEIEAGRIWRQTLTSHGKK